ncbi:CD225/dispanin family protein [Bacillus subtilis subsp. subtilis]|nr:CD225/dispanin family protein [Bacillus subtilis subsp. subtilis]
MNTTAAQIPNHLVWAILATLFCCLPGGIVSIVYAAQVNGKIAAGDLAGARDSSDKAKKWAMWSAIAGVIVAVLYIVLVMAMGGLGALSNSGY